MRVVFSIVLFLTFAIRPAMEISTIMYYQLNIDYIVEKYCVNKERPSLNCNGKCYLMSQMKAKKQPSKEKTDTIIITEAFIPLFFQDQSIQIKSTNSYAVEQDKNWTTIPLYLENFPKDIDHPPEDFLS
ncbi:hypothetical protein M0D21_14810 [Aquimarina sp. D1M17]|nr:hypothetical protein [Aquimarina acroporae]